MPRDKILFAQVLAHLPLRQFHQIVDHHHGNHKIQDFTCLDQFLAMAFAQLTFRSGLRFVSRASWQVELFFKWIKQYLRILCFYGHSENAVRIQVWIAVSVYVLLAIIRKELTSSETCTTFWKY